MKKHSFSNIGSRNKGCMWEYITATAYRDLAVPGSEYRLTQLLSYGENESNQHCLSIEEMASGTELMKKEFESGRYDEKFFKNLKEYYDKPLEIFKRFARSKSPKEFTDEELLKAFDMFSDAAARTYPPMLIAFFAAYLDGYLTEMLRSSVSLSDAELVTLKTVLLTMPHASISEREEAAISSVVKKAKNGSDISNELDDLADRFGWFHMEYAGDPHTREHYGEIIKKRLEQNMPAKDILEAKADVMREQEGFLKTCKDARLKDLIRVFNDFSFILDDSKRATVENHFIMYPLLKEISARIGIQFKDIYFLVGPEIVETFKKPVDASIIAERKKNRAVFLHDGKIEVFSGEKAKELASTYIEAEEASAVQEVKGIVAYPGLYRGRVSVVLNPNDHSKFKDGDVLVTRDGSAEFTYFLQHAGAIVADQGGIISHAAIVARESKVPAILSTKIGTKIFQDGDMVEVDAVKGIVKLIERAKK